jgi:2'-5' RNA ligase
MAAQPRATDRLFFAVFPDRAAVTRLTALGEELRSRHGLKGRVLAPERLHVSLHHVGDYLGVPDAAVTQACEIAAGIRLPAFSVAFNSARSLRGRPDNQPFVVRGDDGVIGLTKLQRRLGAALETAGLGRSAERYAPHVTVMYGDRFVVRQPVEPEIAWTVREFVLVHSLLGQSAYHALRRFRLAGE